MAAVTPTSTAERERIIQAAYHCLTATGGSAVSVTDILSSAGLSTRAFYRHFGSKDALLLALFRRDSDRVLAELQAEASSAPTPREALGGWIAGMLRLTAESRRRRRVLALSSKETQRAAGYAAEWARFRAAQTAAIAHILYRGRDDGSFPHTDPEPDAQAIRAVLGQAFEDQMSRTTAVDADQATAQVLDFVFRALGAGREV